MKISLLLIALPIALTGCATQYDATNPFVRFAGGVEALPIDGTTYRISAKGNAFTSVEKMQDFVLLKAAETTIQRGFTHFIILAEQAGNEARGVLVSPGQYQSTTNAQVTGFGNQVYGTARTTGTYTPPQTQQIYKPSANSIVRLISADDAKGTGAYEAQAVVNAIAPRIKN